MNNTAVGYQSMVSNTTGATNVSVGTRSLQTNLTGSNNTAIGYQALPNNASGAQNTVIGANAAGTLTTGSNNIVIGNNSDVLLSGTSNNVVIGNASSTLYFGGPWTIISDQRDKTNITSITSGINFISKLNPVSFEWAIQPKNSVYIKDTYNPDNDTEINPLTNPEEKSDIIYETNEKNGTIDQGFIAQELITAQKEADFEIPGLVTGFTGSVNEFVYHESSSDKLGATYTKLVPVMVKAIQELNDTIKWLEDRIAALES